MRRLPVYLLLDVSGSMSGEPIEAVKNGMQLLHSALRRDPYALESAYISVITFASNAKQAVPLTEVSQFQPPVISASGGTALGEALSLLTQCVQKEIVKGTAEKKGDWKPLVFLMTDGAPTDDVQSGLTAFKGYPWGTVVACAAGEAANTTLLQQITENVVSLDTTDSSAIASYFKWVSSSISSSSKKVDSGTESDGLSTLPPPPPEITLVS